MSIFKKSFVCLAVAASASAPTARADIGSDTAQLLNLMYQDTRSDCGSPSRPAFLCSGVLLRGTTPSTSYQFYSISPANQSRGGVSVSYLRKDAKFKQLAFNYKSGFLFDAVMENPADHVDYKVLCSFPIDAASGDRAQNGCGDSTRTAGTVENFCGQMGITTAEQWAEHYRKAGSQRHSGQCAFDVRVGSSDTANAFYQSLRAMNLISDESFKEDNELIMEPWKIDPSRSPSILASFYVDDSGLEGARLNQIQWYQATRSKQVLPAISMKLPATVKDDARFAYSLDAQAIYPTTANDACVQWLGKESWTSRRDASLGKVAASLNITLTGCARGIGEIQTNNLLNHLVSRFYLDSHWGLDPNMSEATRKDSIRSMRRQLTCYLSSKRNDETWTLEPVRPYTTQDRSVAAGCNNNS